MRLLLVRHGETVDNVAGLYAGVRDSSLTAHGVLQARRLGSHIAARSASLGPVTHVFSSDLQRAARTAQAVIDAQNEASSASTSAIPGQEQVRLVTVPELRERNFGSAEGKRFGTPRTDAETHEGMRARADRFVVACLAPLLHGGRGLVVVVSHGILLNSLLRVILTTYAPAELTRLAPSGPGPARPEYLASWGNTGYLEMVVNAHPPVAPSGVLVGRSRHDRQHRITLMVVRVNELSHLDGLKKTRGGIGSAQFDSRQRTVDSFFKPPAKRKAED